MEKYTYGLPLGNDGAIQVMSTSSGKMLRFEYVGPDDEYRTFFVRLSNNNFQENLTYRLRSEFEVDTDEPGIEALIADAVEYQKVNYKSTPKPKPTQEVTDLDLLKVAYDALGVVLESDYGADWNEIYGARSQIRARMETLIVGQYFE